MNMSSKVVFLFLIILLNVLMINGDSCRCRCCTGQPCDLKPLPNTFEVQRCWLAGGYACFQRCKEEYPSQCGSSSATVIPVCRASSTFSLNVIFITATIFIRQLFIY